MTILIDYDNDKILIGPEIAFRYYGSTETPDKRIIIFDFRNGMRYVEAFLIELVNMFCDGSEHPPISIQKQSEGAISTVEEY